MRGFLRDLAVFLGLQALVLALLQGFYSRTVLGDHYLAAWRDKLAAIGVEALESVPIPGFDRFECRDPFGNRMEFIQPL